MNEKKQPAQHSAGGLKLSDIYFVLFRHKWKIIICSVLGFVSAGAIYATRPTLYTSEAQVLVKRIKDNTDQTPVAQLQDTIDTSGGPEGLINSEVAILKSFDLATRVVTNVTAAKILGAYGGGDNAIQAAGLIRESLNAERMPRSSVIEISLSLQDKDSVQSILNAVIDAYLEFHNEIHLKSDAWEKLKSQASEEHLRLLDVEKQLQDKEKALGIVDIDAARKTTAEANAKLRFEINGIQLDLDLHKAKLAKLKGELVSVPSVKSNKVTETDIPKQLLENYSEQLKLRERLNSEYVTVLTTYNEGSVVAKEKKAQLDKVEQEIAQMEKREPRLTRQKTVTGLAGTSTADAIASEQDLIDDLEFKLKFLHQEAAEVNSSLTNLDAASSDIRDLQMQINLLSDRYIAATTHAENARLEANIQALNSANIVAFEHPTPPTPEHKKTPKLMAMVAAGGVLTGLGLAFLLELYLDHSVKRPKEIEGELGMRLFLSIPEMQMNGRHKLLPRFRTRGKNGAAQNREANSAANGHTNVEVAPWDGGHGLHQYNESLRDRLITYFESNYLNHKPKLVAITGAAKGAGTSTIAAGLAASLSETGDGNVLLVDMNIEHGSAQQFCQGKLACELDTALETKTRENALIQGNLYVVRGATNGDKLSRMLPKNFANLMPRLKASDYDYIIFDMPPIARTGITQRLAGFMDMMLLVVEAEKTSRDLVKQAGAVLNESKANISVVLNKTRRYVPASLHQEIS